jgi:hypothetical protein
MVSISVVRVCAVQKLFLDNMKRIGVGPAGSKNTNRTHQAIDNFQVAVTGRILVNPFDLSSLAWTEGESHLHMSGVTP